MSMLVRARLRDRSDRPQSRGMRVRRRRRDDQLSVSRAVRESDRRVAFRTRGFLFPIEGLLYPVVWIPVPTAFYARLRTHAVARDDRFAKQTHFAFTGPVPPQRPGSVCRPTWKAQVDVASRDLAHGGDSSLRGCLPQNKPNLPPGGPALDARPGAVEVSRLRRS